MKKHFIADDSFIIRGRVPSGAVGGSNWAEFISTNSEYGPGGIMDQTPGIFAKTNIIEPGDPPRVELISGVYGLPVSYYSSANVISSVL